MRWQIFKFVYKFISASGCAKKQRATSNRCGANRKKLCQYLSQLGFGSSAKT